MPVGGAYWTTLALRGVADEVADEVAEVAEVVDEVVCLGRARCSWVCTGQLQQENGAAEEPTRSWRRRLEETLKRRPQPSRVHW
jgi:hypothetical protein